MIYKAKIITDEQAREVVLHLEYEGTVRSMSVSYTNELSKEGCQKVLEDMGIKTFWALVSLGNEDYEKMLLDPGSFRDVFERIPMPEVEFTYETTGQTTDKIYTNSSKYELLGLFVIFIVCLIGFLVVALLEKLV